MKRQQLRSLRAEHYWTATALVAICTVLIVTFFGRYALDDSYIGYVNASHLAAGSGFSFNPPDRILTTSAPLMVLIYGACLRLTHIDIITQGQLASAFSLSVLTAASYLTCLRYFRPIGAGIAVFVFITSPNVVLMWSHETLIAAMFAVSAITCRLYGKLYAAAVLFGLGTLTRPEVLFCVAAAVWMDVRAKRGRQAFVTGVISSSIVACWALPAFCRFGTWTSQSIAAKHAQSTYTTITYLPSLAVFTLIYYQELSANICAALGIMAAVPLGGAILATRYTIAAVRNCLAWVLFVTCFYVAMQVYYFPWFAVQIALLVALIAASPWLREGKFGVVARNALRGCSIVVLIIHVCLAWQLAVNPETKFRIPSTQGLVMPKLADNNYYRLALALRARTSANDTIAYPEIGILRYYGERTVIDYMGLATAGVPQRLLAGDRSWFFKAYRPTIFVDAVGEFTVFLDAFEHPWFDRAYRVSEELQLPRDPRRDRFRIYRLVDPQRIPPNEELLPQIPLDISADERTIRILPSRPKPTAFDLRIDTRACTHGRARFFVDDRLHAETAIAPGQESPITRPRFDVPEAAARMRIELKGCSAHALAPPAMPHRGLLLFAAEPEIGGPNTALSAYARVAN